MYPAIAACAGADVLPAADTFVHLFEWRRACL